MEKAMRVNEQPGGENRIVPFKAAPRTVRATLRGLRSLVALLVSGALAVSLGLVGGALPGSADTTPGAGIPATVAADGLPTVQHNGVAWAQVIIGNKVYVGG